MPDYDWSNSLDDIVFQPNPAVAVYLNVDGDVVIRQQRDQYEDEDSVVIIPRGTVPALIRKISSVAELKPGTLRLVKD